MLLARQSLRNGDGTAKIVSQKVMQMMQYLQVNRKKSERQIAFSHPERELFWLPQNL